MNPDAKCILDLDARIAEAVIYRQGAITVYFCILDLDAKIALFKKTPLPSYKGREVRDPTLFKCTCTFISITVTAPTVSPYYFQATSS